MKGTRHRVHPVGFLLYKVQKQAKQIYEVEIRRVATTAEGRVKVVAGRSREAGFGNVGYVLFLDMVSSLSQNSLSCTVVIF